MSTGTGGIGHRMARMLPGRWRTTLRGWLRGWLGRHPTSSENTERTGPPVEEGPPPALSVIIPIYNVELYLDETLRSVLQQSWRSLEVIVVDDGSTDSGPAIAAAHRARDPRIRLLGQANAGQGAARNRGVAAARGEYLIFLDGDDVVPRTAYATMIETLRQTGSDFVLAPVTRLRPTGRLSPPGWHRIVFGRRRLGTRIEEFPAALFDVLACNRMFRRSFWLDRVEPFRGGIAYEDHVPMVSAFLRAERFDVITEVCYHWRIRADGSSTRQQKQSLTNLSDRLAVKAEAYALLRTEASAPVLALWLARVLELDLHPFVGHALDAGPEYRRLLQTGYARYLGAAGPDALDHVRVERKITAYLAAAGRWEAIGRLRDGLRSWGDPPPVVARRGRLELRADAASVVGVRLPARLCGLSRYESAGVGCLSDLAWHGGQLEIEGWALIKNLDDGHRDPILTGWLTDGESRIPIGVAALFTPEATVWSRDRFARHDRCGFRLTLDQTTLTRLTDDRVWRLGLRIEHHDIDRLVGTWSVLAGSRAVRSELPGQVIDGVAVAVRIDAGRGLQLSARAGPELVEGPMTGDPGSAPGAPRPARALSPSKGRWRVTVETSRPYPPWSTSTPPPE